jgi:tRNA threonylcarbamoyladenosine biosynthesis protein TsaB
VKILALDTATEACSAAVLTPQRMASRFLELDRGHSERILGMVDAVLAEASLALAELDAVAFGRGPGAFTGARLAASIAQGLAFGAGLRVVPVSDLRALAQRALDDAPGAQNVIVCADARMKEVYWACYRRDPGGLAEPCEEGERVGSPQTVELPPVLEGTTHGVGRGFLAYPQLAARLEGRLAAIRADLLPRAEEVARLAAIDLAAGHSVAAEDAVPTYLRNDVARPPRERRD